MELKHFNDPQRQALLDLALLAMYADAHLDSAEDNRVHKLLTAMGYTSDYERQRYYDASVARVNRLAATPDAAQNQARALAQLFTTDEQRREVREFITELVASDSKVTEPESKLLATIAAALTD